MFKCVRFSRPIYVTGVAVVCAALAAGCASRSEPGTAQQALPKRNTTSSVEFGPECHDPRDRALPRDSGPAHDPMFTQCDPDYYVVQGQRRRLGPGPVLERGSINLPDTPVPLPNNLGVFRR